MGKKLKISVVTPSFNSGDKLEQAIESVLMQDYPVFEHIVMDGMSTDNTLDILRYYPHINWLSEPDSGQVDAMNKGFQLTSGDIIVYLNADDCFLPNAFNTVIETFENDPEIDMVMGNVLVQNDRLIDGKMSWLNDPQPVLPSMIRHWMGRFCVNPVGYYYRRHVQENIPFNLENDDKQDLEFLLEVVLKYRIEKISATLGVFNLETQTKTARAMQSPTYWNFDNFSFIEKFAKELPDQSFESFQQERKRAYQRMRSISVRRMIEAETDFSEFFNKDMFILPKKREEHEDNFDKVHDDKDIAVRSDTIIGHFTSGFRRDQILLKALRRYDNGLFHKVTYSLILDSFKDLIVQPGVLLRENRYFDDRFKSFFDQNKDHFQWKFFIGIHDPVSMIIQQLVMQGITDKELIKDSILKESSSFIKNMIVRVEEFTGIKANINSLNQDSGYKRITNENIELIAFHYDYLNDHLPTMIEDVFGVADTKTLAVDENSLSQLRGMNFDLEELSKIYEEGIIQQLFTKDKISRFKKKWLR